ncbi:MAG: flagellar biosynthetic protein FliO [Pseudomonadota bacterium]
MSAPLFAAPAAGAAHSTGGGLAEVTLALIVIVALIAALAWLGKRMRGFGAVGGGRDRIQVLSSQALGPKERCMLIRVGDTDILIGVAQGNVRPLHVFPAGANTEAPPAPPATGPKLPNFKELLMKSLGK